MVQVDRYVLIPIQILITLLTLSRLLPPLLPVLLLIQEQLELPLPILLQAQLQLERLPLPGPQMQEREPELEPEPPERVAPLVEMQPRAERDESKELAANSSHKKF